MNTEKRMDEMKQIRKLTAICKANLILFSECARMELIYKSNPVHPTNVCSTCPFSFKMKHTHCMGTRIMSAGVI